jgi:hypothetical protein
MSHLIQSIRPDRTACHVREERKKLEDSVGESWVSHREEAKAFYKTLLPISAKLEQGQNHRPPDRRYRREKNLPRDSPARGAWGKGCLHRTALAACSSLHDPGISLAEVLAWRFLLRRWMASLLFELISPSQRFIGFGSFLCHVQSFPQTKPDYHARGFQTAPLPELS